MKNLIDHKNFMYRGMQITMRIVAFNDLVPNNMHAEVSVRDINSPGYKELGFSRFQINNLSDDEIVARVIGLADSAIARTNGSFEVVKTQVGL